MRNSPQIVKFASEETCIFIYFMRNSSHNCDFCDYIWLLISLVEAMAQVYMNVLYI